MPKPAARTKATDAPAAAAGTSDDLTKIEGIGPKISSALKAAGIDTFAKLAEANEADLSGALETAGLRFAPSLHTWARQAAFAAQGDWDGLKELQDHLVSGRDPDEKH
ncbi:MAG: helix-hairpin-helix domain-containing protein [Chloroflexota bacterium]